MSGLDFVGYVFGGLLLLGALAVLAGVLWVCFSPTMRRIRAEKKTWEAEFDQRHAQTQRDIDEERQPRSLNR